MSSSDTPYTLGFRKAYKITNGNQTSGAGAADYVGVEQRIEAQNVVNSGWNYTSPSSFVTFSFWVKPKSYAGSTSGNTLLGNSNGTPSANQWNMWIYGVDGKIRLVWYNQTNSAGNFMVTDFSFGAGTVNQEWVQVVLTRVGTTVTFYFNGVVDTATAGTLSSSSITLDDSSNATMRLPSPWGGALYNQDGF